MRIHLISIRIKVHHCEEEQRSNRCAAEFDLVYQFVSWLNIKDAAVSIVTTDQRELAEGKHLTTKPDCRQAGALRFYTKFTKNCICVFCFCGSLLSLCGPFCQAGRLSGQSFF